jgi:hypothetical protein
LAHTRYSHFQTIKLQQLQLHIFYDLQGWPGLDTNCPHKMTHIILTFIQPKTIVLFRYFFYVKWEQIPLKHCQSCKCHNPRVWLISQMCDITDWYMISENILNLPVLTHIGCLHCKTYCGNSILFLRNNLWYSEKWFAKWQWFASHGFRNTGPEHNDLVLYKFSDIKTSFQVLLKMSDDWQSAPHKENSI